MFILWSKQKIYLKLLVQLICFLHLMLDSETRPHSCMLAFYHSYISAYSYWLKIQSWSACDRRCETVCYSSIYDVEVEGSQEEVWISQQCPILKIEDGR